MFILFRPIREGADITRHFLIALAGALIIALVVLATTLAAKAFFLTAQDEAVKKRRWVAESALREGNAPMGTYGFAPGGWRNIETGMVYKNGK